jgi:hypothetical protein
MATITTGQLTWKRVRRKGQLGAQTKEWVDISGSYSIVWRSEAFGVAVTPNYRAFLVHYEQGTTSRREFVGGKPKEYRKFETAAAACERHNKGVAP